MSEIPICNWCGKQEDGLMVIMSRDGRDVHVCQDCFDFFFKDPEYLDDLDAYLDDHEEGR